MAATTKKEETTEKVVLPDNVNMLDKTFQRLFRDESIDKTLVIAYLGICEAAWKDAMLGAKKYSQAYEKALVMIDTNRDDFSEKDLEDLAKKVDGRTLKGQ